MQKQNLNFMPNNHMPHQGNIPKVIKWMLFYFFPRGCCHRQTSVISISLPPFWCLSISIHSSIFSREYWNWQLNWQFSILQGRQGNATLKKDSWSRDLAGHLLRQVSKKGRKTRHWEISVILIHSTEVKIYHSTFQLKWLNILWNEYIKAQLLPVISSFEEFHVMISHEK